MMGEFIETITEGIMWVNQGQVKVTRLIWNPNFPPHTSQADSCDQCFNLQARVEAVGGGVAKKGVCSELSEHQASLWHHTLDTPKWRHPKSLVAFEKSWL